MLRQEVAAEGGALVSGSVSQCPSYLAGKSKNEVQAEYSKQISFFVEEGLDFLICEVGHIVIGYVGYRRQKLHFIQHTKVLLPFRPVSSLVLG